MSKLLYFLVLKTVFLISIGSISSLKNDTKILNVNKSDSLTKGPNYKCSKYFYQIQQELAAVIPPLDSLKDNYHSIYQALYPSNNLPSLYVKVTIQFLLDYQNGTKTIDETRTKKMTWSESCTFVSVDQISLNAMSLFSLGTILPQRRQTELTVTVSPVCPNTTLQEDDNLWRDVVFMLQDIAVIANLSDPQLNTAQCVVNGQENSSQRIVCPYTSGFRRIFVWNIAYLVLGTAIVLSLVVWYYLHSLLLHHFTRLNGNTTNASGNATELPEFKGAASSGIPATNRPTRKRAAEAEPFVGPREGSCRSENSSHKSQSHTKDLLKIYLGVSYKMIWYMFFLTCVSFGFSIYLVIAYPYQCKYLICYLASAVVISIVTAIYSFLKAKKDSLKCEFWCFRGCCKCVKRCKCMTAHSLCLLFPIVFQTVHHLLWVLCGIVTEPYWATPIVLLEGLAMLSLIYAIYLYHRDVIEDDNDWSGCDDRIKVIAHLFFTLICFWAVLFIVAVIGYGGIVNVPSAGVIQVIATAIFVWLIKMSGIKLNR